MSKHTMSKFNIKSYREVRDGILLCDTTGDEWLLREDNILLHRNNRNRRNNIDFHRQCEVKGLYHCLGYIRRHSKRYTYKARTSKMERLFAMI